MRISSSSVERSPKVEIRTEVDPRTEIQTLTEVETKTKTEKCVNNEKMTSHCEQIQKQIIKDEENGTNRDHAQNNKPTRKSRGQSNTFLEKLHAIVSDPRNHEWINWSDDGTAITIKKPIEFASTLLPKFFKHSNFQSFVRQLNTYNFRKTTRELDQWEFRRSHFKRDKFQVILQRKQRKNNTNLTCKDIPSFREQEDLIQREMCSVRKDVKLLLIEQETAEKELSALSNQYITLEASNRLLWDAVLKADHLSPSHVHDIFMSMLERQREQHQLVEQLSYQIQVHSSEDVNFPLPQYIVDGCPSISDLQELLYSQSDAFAHHIILANQRLYPKRESTFHENPYHKESSASTTADKEIGSQLHYPSSIYY